MLGLLHRTEASWAELACARLEALLIDHAHCELKAASNALSLAARVPGDVGLTRALLDLSEEELAHFRRVLDEIEARGARLGPPGEDGYVAELRKRASASRVREAPREAYRRGQPAGGLEGAPLVDRLLVGALIEARSCERFALLVAPLRARGEARLADFYDELFACEARHYRVLLDLAIQASASEAEVRRRLDELLLIEADVARTLGGAGAMHG